MSGVLQGWLSVKHDNLRQAGAMNEATMTALVGASNRLADIHMGLADVMSRCGDFLPDSEPVSRKDKLAHNAVQAKGVLRAAGDLKGHVDIPDADHQRIMDVLKAHSDKLDRMLTLEGSGQTFSEADVSVDAVDDLPLETGELWEMISPSASTLIRARSGSLEASCRKWIRLKRAARLTMTGCRRFPGGCRSVSCSTSLWVIN